MEAPCRKAKRVLDAASTLIAYVVVYVAVSLGSVVAMVGFWGLVKLLAPRGWRPLFHRKALDAQE